MLSKVFSASVLGIDGHLVTVEVDIAPGLPNLFTVGLPDASIREAKSRVVSAIRNSGFEFPIKKITVNLAPTNIRKEGAGFDLPIAIGILAASQTVRDQFLSQWCLIGELALDGSIRSVRGILPVVIEAKERNLKGVILPYSNWEEASVVKGIKIWGAKSLKEVCNILNEDLETLTFPDAPLTAPQIQEKSDLDFADVKGHHFAKRALEVACAGGHNVLLMGPPGSGKTMLSQRITTILPPLTFEESIETTKIHSVAGFLPRNRGLIETRPFRSPHHTISDIALIGGGQTPKPGEVSLAHNGVLFLDELPEFHRNVLEVLRQPLESREVTISRVKETIRFPSSFMFIAAMNPCPCGFLGHPLRECLCTHYKIQKYKAKVSGPLLDRIDIHLEIPALKTEEIIEEAGPQESSEKIRGRVLKSRNIQNERFSREKNPYSVNAQMNSKSLKKYCLLDSESKSLLKRTIENWGLSARAHDRIIKLARTVADLENSEKISLEHLAEAIQYRILDRKAI